MMTDVVRKIIFRKKEVEVPDSEDDVKSLKRLTLSFKRTDK